MLHKGFVVAMSAEVSCAEYDCPARVTGVERAWIIVSRFGGAAEHLTIASAAQAGPLDEEAPPGLRPRETLCSVLASEDADGTGCSFLIVRRPPIGFVVAGTFFPADGYVRLTWRSGELRMDACGRHSHSVGTRDGGVVRKDVPDPAPHAGHTLAWHIRGTRRRWHGEFVVGPHAPGRRGRGPEPSRPRGRSGGNKGGPRVEGGR